MEKKRGRPPKKEYNQQELTKALTAIVSETYAKTNEIKATAMELKLPPHKVKKLLITSGAIVYPETEEIQRLLVAGKTIPEISQYLGTSPKTLNTYLPYTKVIYKLDEISQNAERVKRYKLRKRLVEELQEQMTIDCLCECVVAFQDYPFFTVTGLPFQYQLKVGRNGEVTRELLVDRRQDSKTLAWSSVVLAFEKSQGISDLVKKPKQIGDIRGISYIYPMLWRFGVIQVPEKIEEKLRGRKK